MRFLSNSNLTHRLLYTLLRCATIYALLALASQNGREAALSKFSFRNSYTNNNSYFLLQNALKYLTYIKSCKHKEVNAYRTLTVCKLQKYDAYYRLKKPFDR